MHQENRVHIYTCPAKDDKVLIYKKRYTFFVLSHPGGKQEFDNNIESIKSALKFYKPEECSETVINDIKAFVTHTPIKPAITAQKKNFDTWKELQEISQ